MKVKLYEFRAPRELSVGEYDNLKATFVREMEALGQMPEDYARNVAGPSILKMLLMGVPNFKPKWVHIGFVEVL